MRESRRGLNANELRKRLLERELELTIYARPAGEPDDRTHVLRCSESRC
jgi:hypothetical protein